MKKSETIGVLFVLLSAMLWGGYPVLVHVGVQEVAPITFAALSAVVAAVVSGIYMVATGSGSDLRVKKVYIPIVMITICIVVIPMTLFFIGVQYTSGLNASLLLLSEIIFMLIITPVLGERTSLFKILGAGGVLIGAVCIVYNGSFSLNIGDALIVASTVPITVGNFYAKKALFLVEPSTIIFLRYTLGMVCIFGIASVVEPDAEVLQIIRDHWGIILLNGMLLLGISKLIWYEGLKRLDISKAIPIVMTYPLFSLLLLVLFFDQSISAYQLVGMIFLAVGVYFTVRRPSTDPNITKYAPGE